MSSLNDAPVGERVRIGFFGVRNAGKSSLVNAFTGQDLAVVSGTPGTTTDAVEKTMELLPAGPVVVIDTPGIDDEGPLGAQRVERARRALRSCDAAVLVVDATRGMLPADEALLAEFAERAVPHVVAWNKADALESAAVESGPPASPTGAPAVFTSARTGAGVRELKELIAHVARRAPAEKRLVADLVGEGDAVVLVTPIDESAPKGRIILPQQMVLRDCLDAHALALVCQPGQLAAALASLGRPPRLVVTDSQVFAQVAAIVPRDVALTSFSVLMARYKGELSSYAPGADAIGRLRDGSRVLVSEGCTHHRQCEDIGTVKIPRWVREACGAQPAFEFTSGGEFPDELEGVELVIHCGGCMLNEREMRHRVRTAQAAGVPIVNYGMAIARMHGILERALEPFGAG